MKLLATRPPARLRARASAPGGIAAPAPASRCRSRSAPTISRLGAARLAADRPGRRPSQAVTPGLRRWVAHRCKRHPHDGFAGEPDTIDIPAPRSSGTRFYCIESRPFTRPPFPSDPMYNVKGQLDLNSTLKQYSSLVRRLAHQMIAKLPANVEIDDLIQVGMIGLTDALSRFDAAQGVQFETFATQRIRGAMLDELRGNDYLSRGTRKQQRTIESAVTSSSRSSAARRSRARSRSRWR
jgi:hypothetical protein